MASRDWPSLIPLDNRIVPEFPVEALPKVLRDYVLALGEAYQVPADLPALLSLAVVGAAISKKLKIKAGSDWSEPTNLYVIVALPPASRKSSIFRAITDPLRKIEKREADHAAPIIKDAMEKREVIDKAIKQARRDAVDEAAEGKPPKINTIRSLENQRQDPPRPFRLLADVVTPEKLVQLLSENEGRLAIMSAEGGVFDHMGGKYNNNNPNLESYLQGHCGDAIRVDRIGRDSLYIDDPALTIGLAVQPDVLQGLSKRPGFQGRGLLARFLYSLPLSNVGFRKIQTEEVPTWLRKQYFKLIEALTLLGGTATLGDESWPKYLIWEREARDHFNLYREQVEAQLRPGGQLESLKDWGGKLPGAVARLAAILHAVDNPRPPGDSAVNASTLQNAIRLGNYFKVHALAAYDLMGTDFVLERAKKVIRWILAKERWQFSARHLHQDMRGTFKTMIEVNETLALLQAHMYIMPINDATRRGSGRPPSMRYDVNPEILTQYPQYCPRSAQSMVGRGF